MLWVQMESTPGISSGREADNIAARPLSIIYEKSQRSGYVPDDWRRANTSTRRAQKRAH